MQNRRVAVSLAVSAVLAVAFWGLNIFWGSIHIPAANVAEALSGGDVSATVHFIVVESRLPRAVTAALCGAALAAAGLIMQTVFANPLADPSILGVNAGASLGVAVVMLFMGGSAAACVASLSGFALTAAAALAGSLLALALLTMLAAVVRSGYVLLIAGIMVGYVVSAVIGLFATLSSAEGLRAYVFWGMGDFGGVSTRVLPLFAAVMAAALVMALAMSKPLNAMLLGENYAENLGVPVRRTRIAAFIITGVLSAVPTSLCGPVAFVGLAVPHMARFASQTSNHLVLLPLTMLMGAAVAGACNIICSIPPDGTLIPLNVVTSLWGVPIILYVLFSSARRKALK